MLNTLAKIGLRGKRAAEHDDEDAKANEDEDDVKAMDDDEDEAKAMDDDEDEAKAAEDDDEKEAKAVARAVKAASAKASAKAHEIAVLCKVGKRPDLTDEFIASGASPAAVGERLLELRADASHVGEIAAQTGPNGSPAASAAMWDHATEKNTKVFGLGK